MVCTVQSGPVKGNSALAGCYFTWITSIAPVRRSTLMPHLRGRIAHLRLWVRSLAHPVGNNGQRNARVLIRYRRSNTYDAGTVSAAVISLGYLANRGSDRALKYLVQKVDAVDSAMADWRADRRELVGAREP